MGTLEENIKRAVESCRKEGIVSTVEGIVCMEGNFVVLGCSRLSDSRAPMARS